MEYTELVFLFSKNIIAEISVKIQWNKGFYLEVTCHSITFFIKHEIFITYFLTSSFVMCLSNINQPLN